MTSLLAQVDRKITSYASSDVGVLTLVKQLPVSKLTAELCNKLLKYNCAKSAKYVCEKNPKITFGSLSWESVNSRYQYSTYGRSRIQCMELVFSKYTPQFENIIWKRVCSEKVFDALLKTYSKEVKANGPEIYKKIQPSYCFNQSKGSIISKLLKLLYPPPLALDDIKAMILQLKPHYICVKEYLAPLTQPDLTQLVKLLLDNGDKYVGNYLEHLKTATFDLINQYISFNSSHRHGCVGDYENSIRHMFETFSEMLCEKLLDRCVELHRQYLLRNLLGILNRTRSKFTLTYSRLESLIRLCKPNCSNNTVSFELLKKHIETHKDRIHDIFDIFVSSKHQDLGNLVKFMDNDLTFTELKRVVSGQDVHVRYASLTGIIARLSKDQINELLKTMQSANYKDTATFVDKYYVELDKTQEVVETLCKDYKNYKVIKKLEKNFALTQKCLDNAVTAATSGYEFVKYRTLIKFIIEHGAVVVSKAQVVATMGAGKMSAGEKIILNRFLDNCECDKTN